jgi:thiol-disulfide isomerase/thioredoxin
MKLLTHRFALRVAVVGLLLVVAYGVLAPGRKTVKAPPLPHAALQGGPMTIAKLHGHPEAIVFFASWCPGCHTEALAVERFASSHAGSGKVLSIDYSDYGNVRGFISRYRWTFPVLRDPDGVTGDAYGVAHLPTTVILNAKGEIVARDVGPQTVASLSRAVNAAS